MVITYTNGTAQSVDVVKGEQKATISDLTNGTPYTFTVKTVDTTGNTSEGTSTTATPAPVINAATPTITGQPTAANYTQDTTATALTVTATVTDGGTLSYQWYRNTSNSTTGGTAVGTDIASYTPDTSATGTLYYYVVVTNTNNGVNGNKTASATSNAVAITVTPTPYVLADSTNKDIKAKFGDSTASAAFAHLHELISTPHGADNFTSIISPGDYIDLPSLTIGATTIPDAAITPSPLPFAGYEGRLLRLIVVGINSFSTTNPTAPGHVVFQFQNIPVTPSMEANDTNANGYAGSAMQTYLMGGFLTGLKTATGLTDDMLMSPTRKVANKGQGADGTHDITDTLWLPTAWEMLNAQGNSSTTYETSANQAPA